MFLVFLKAICLLSAFACVSAINLSPTRSFLPNRRFLIDANATTIEEMYTDYKKDPSVEVHTSGYLRLDTSDWLRGIWIQAQVLPIGECFKEGFHGGSAMLSEVLLVSNSVFRNTKIFRTPNCTGEARDLPFVQPRKEATHQLEQTVSHVPYFTDAVAVYPPGASGMIVSSYYSAEGCSGNVAQYDLVSEACSVYGYPIGAFGTFRCDADAQSMLLTLYGPFEMDSFTYPVCTPFDMDDVEFAYNQYYSYYEYGAHVYKQPLTCFDEGNAGESDDMVYPYFQTIDCVAGHRDADQQQQQRGGYAGYGRDQLYDPTLGQP